MGDTLRYAEKLDLINMEPRGDLTATNFALVNSGKEYLVLQPEVCNMMSVERQNRIVKLPLPPQTASSGHFTKYSRLGAWQKKRISLETNT